MATDMDSPNPDSGEEYYHTNTQLYGILDDHNRFKIGDAAAAPWNRRAAPAKKQCSARSLGDRGRMIPYPASTLPVASAAA